MNASTAGPYWSYQLVAPIGTTNACSTMSGTNCKHFHVHGCVYGVVEQWGGQGDQKTLVVSFVEPWEAKGPRAKLWWLSRTCRT